MEKEYSYEDCLSTSAASNDSVALFQVDDSWLDQVKLKSILPSSTFEWKMLSQQLKVIYIYIYISNVASQLLVQLLAWNLAWTSQTIYKLETDHN